MLFVECYMLNGVCCSLFVVCCLLVDVERLLVIVCWLVFLGSSLFVV